jgi:(S)-3,5-dihydroxyphenylglycine transaminase
VPAASPGWAELDPAALHPSLEDPALTSMTFLNEVSSRYPGAVSFAPGRPYEGFWDVAKLTGYLESYCDHLRKERGLGDAGISRALHQYGRTKGVINEIVARHLSVDENIGADPDAIVVTVGCQEAMYLVLRALRAGEHDVLLAVSPTYVGLTGAARLVDLPVLPVAGGADGVDLADLRACLARARAEGRRPRALYVMPDFANPSGLSMPVPVRRELLELAAREDILLLEDNPYGLFHDGDAAHRPPTLKALDTSGRVVYLGSFAKTALPGARVGYVVADQRIRGREGTFADELTKIKSMVTVNTSPISQAIVAGRLLQHEGSLDLANAAERRHYQRVLHRMLDGLRRRSAALPGVTWNSPRGGFFVVLTVPVVVGDAELEYSGRVHGVLWTPMRHFYGGSGGACQLRLSCSVLDEDEIEEGLDRLVSFLGAVMTREAAAADRDHMR